jgi:hypothetical protein
MPKERGKRGRQWSTKYYTENYIHKATKEGQNEFK